MQSLSDLRQLDPYDHLSAFPDLTCRPAARVCPTIQYAVQKFSLTLPSTRPEATLRSLRHLACSQSHEVLKRIPPRLCRAIATNSLRSVSSSRRGLSTPFANRDKPRFARGRQSETRTRVIKSRDKQTSSKESRLLKGPRHSRHSLTASTGCCYYYYLTILPRTLLSLAHSHQQVAFGIENKLSRGNTYHYVSL